MNQRHKKTVRRNRGEQGQVLILAVVAIVLIIIAILLLFDIQTVIRGKVKSQNAVDAAALTAAEWQKHSLNLIGELNLVRATGALLSEPYGPFLARGILEDPHSNAAEYFADLPNPIVLNKFTLFPEKKSFYFYKEDGSLDKEKMAREILKALNYVGKQKAYLAGLDDLVSQLQTRISFVGPLIAFGAAQQAAKNNGVTYDREAGEFFKDYLERIGGLNRSEGASIYERIASTSIHGYPWRQPYFHMVSSIADFEDKYNAITGENETIAYGIAAGTKIKFAGMPSLVGNPPTDLSYYLGLREFYDWVHARNWCELYRALRLDYSGTWWGDFDCDYEYDFSEQSEILPVNITFAGKDTGPYEEAFGQHGTTCNCNGACGARCNCVVSCSDTDGRKKVALNQFNIRSEELFAEIFNRENPFYDPEVRREEPVITQDGDRIQITSRYTVSIPSEIRKSIMDDPESFLLTYYNDEDAGRLYDLLPELSWATYNDKWMAYDDDQTEWNEYLRGHKFKAGMDYQSGAQAYFELKQDTETITGSMGRDIRNSDGNSRHSPDVGQVFASARTDGEAQRLSRSLRYMGNINRIVTNAEAKPIGSILCADGTRIRPFEAGRMILPVFTDTALIPIALEPVEGFSSAIDVAWLYYLTEFVPLLSGSPSIQDSWERAEELYPAHLKYYGYFVQALHMINDPNYRLEGLRWLEAPAVWTQNEDGERVVLYNRYEYDCLGFGKPHVHGDGGVGGRGPGSGISHGGGGVPTKGGPDKLH